MWSHEGELYYPRKTRVLNDKRASLLHRIEKSIVEVLGRKLKPFSNPRLTNQLMNKMTPRGPIKRGDRF